jgi:uncharacterized protein DUF1963
MLQEKIESIMEQIEVRAILAMRPYPPVDLPLVCSQLGGLPLLQEAGDWPRASDGTPLHFLARIDCSELVEPRWRLPDSGILQFFARIDEEMDWADPSSNYSRVLYTPANQGREFPPPTDLPPIEGGYHDYDRDMRLTDEPHSRVYPQWPLTFRSIRSWPMSPDIDPSGGVPMPAYRDAVERARSAEIVRTTGRPTNPMRQAEWGEYFINREGKRTVRLPGDTAQSAVFPQAWVIVDRVSRALACLARQKITSLNKARQRGQELSSGANPEQLTSEIEAIEQQSLSWVERAKSAGLEEATTEADASEFKDWLTRLGSDDRFEITLLLSRALKRGMSAAINYCGGSPKAARLVPVNYMNYLEGEHSLTFPDTYGIEVRAPRRRISARHHQLLGHAPATQDIGVRTTRDVLLLHLVSDPGVGFLFCDCGEVQFWIDAEDLAARNFDRVTANTQGG